MPFLLSPGDLEINSFSTPSVSSLTSLFKAILYTKYVGGKITIMENQLREHSVCTCMQSSHFGRGGQEFKMNLSYTARFEAGQDYMRSCSKNTKLNKQAFCPLSNALHQIKTLLLQAQMNNKYSYFSIKT